MGSIKEFAEEKSEEVEAFPSSVGFNLSRGDAPLNSKVESRELIKVLCTHSIKLSSLHCLRTSKRSSMEGRWSKCIVLPITKSNKLLSFHLTYTQLVLAQAHLLHLQRMNSSRLKHKQSTRSSLFCSKLFLFFSRVASGFQGVKRQLK